MDRHTAGSKQRNLGRDRQSAPSCPPPQSVNVLADRTLSRFAARQTYIESLLVAEWLWNTKRTSEAVGETSISSARASKYSLVNARFSPDNRWVSFTARIEPNRGWIMIAPVDGPKPVPRARGSRLRKQAPRTGPTGRPTGRRCTSPRRGMGRCLWGQRIDARSHRPEGEAFTAEYFHGRASLDPGGGRRPAGGSQWC